MHLCITWPQWVKYTAHYSGILPPTHAFDTCCRHRTIHMYGAGTALQWRHNDHDGVLNHQPHGCLINRLFGRRSKKTSKLCVTGLCAGNSPRTGEFPAQMASYAKKVSIWWRHHGKSWYGCLCHISLLYIIFSIRNKQAGLIFLH